MDYPTGKAHPWHARPRWQKRIQGFLCYAMNAVFALCWPEAADRVMYETLREQFEEDSQ
jgi:hypothetical protein